MKILLLSLLAFSAQTFAGGGDRVGNGGDVVVCGDRVELLDLYEARVKGHKPLKLESDTHEEMLNEVIERRIHRLQPLRAKRFRDYGEEFFKESIILPGIELSDVDDAGLAVIPRGCKLEQIVIQLSDADIPPGGHRYTISQDLWDQLDEFNKMALMLHEVIYREAILNRTGRSMIVRALVGQILRTEMDEALFLELTKGQGPKLEIFSFEVYTDPYTYDSRDPLKVRRTGENTFRFEADKLVLCLKPFIDHCAYGRKADVSPKGFKMDDGAESRFFEAGEVIEAQNARITLDVRSFFHRMKSLILPLVKGGTGTFEVLGTIPATIMLRNVSFLRLDSKDGGQFKFSGFGISGGRIGELDLTADASAEIYTTPNWSVGVKTQKSMIVKDEGKQFHATGLWVVYRKVILENISLIEGTPLELNLFGRFTVPIRSRYSRPHSLYYDLGNMAGSLDIAYIEVLTDVILRPAAGRNRPALVLKKGAYVFQRAAYAVTFTGDSLETRGSFKVFSDGRIE